MCVFLKKKATPQGGKQLGDSAAAVQHKPDLRRDRQHKAAVVAAPYAATDGSKFVGKTEVMSQQDRRVDLPAVSERRFAATAKAATAAVYSSDEYGGDPFIDKKAEDYIASFRNKLKNQNQLLME